MTAQAFLARWREAVENFQALAEDAPANAIPGLLGELEAVKARLWFRLQVDGRSSSNGSPETMTPEEVADLLKVSRAFVYRHAQELGGSALSDRCLRFRRAGVDRYLSRKQV